MKTILAFIFVFTICLLMMFVGIQLDLAFNNNWLVAAAPNFSIFNYLTTKHGLSVLYLNYGFGWLWFGIPVSAVSSTVVTYLSNKY